MADEPRGDALMLSDEALDLKALAHFRSNPPAFLLVPVKQRKTPTK